jgi:hypothetical protein
LLAAIRLTPLLAAAIRSNDNPTAAVPRTPSLSMSRRLSFAMIVLSTKYSRRRL